VIGKSQWCCSANAAIQLHALTYNWTRVVQLANTPPLQTTTLGLHSVSIHQMAPPVWGSRHLITTYYSIYRPRKDERLCWPSWLTCSRQFTHISGHPASAAGRAQDRECSPAEDRRSTTHCALCYVARFIVRAAVCESRDAGLLASAACGLRKSMERLARLHAYDS